jgi:hypothetical protein
MKILNVKKHFFGGDTDVSLEAPEFENFGNRLEEIQDLADKANPTDPEEVRASTAEMMERMRTQMEDARKKHDAMPAGPKKGNGFHDAGHARANGRNRSPGPGRIRTT